MFSVSSTSEKLVLRSPNRLPQIGLAGLAVLLFYGAWNADVDDTAGRLAMAMTGIGFLAAAWFIFPKQTIVFDRLAGEVVNERRRIGRVDRQVVRLDTIRRVFVEKNDVDGAPTQRLALMTDSARVPLETAFGSSPRDDLAKQINEWLKT